MPHSPEPPSATVATETGPLQPQASSAPAGPRAALCHAAAQCPTVSWGLCCAHPHTMGFLHCSWPCPPPQAHPRACSKPLSVGTPQGTGDAALGQGGRDQPAAPTPAVARQGQAHRDERGPTRAGWPRPQPPSHPLHSTHGALAGRSVLRALLLQGGDGRSSAAVTKPGRAGAAPAPPEPNKPLLQEGLRPDPAQARPLLWSAVSARGHCQTPSRPPA